MTPPALWYTSRSAAELGQRSCGYARYLGYHAGAHGTGWSRTSLSIPLATGSGVHTGAELLNTWILDYQQHHDQRVPPNWPIAHREVIAWAALEAAARYEATAKARGFAEVDMCEVESEAALKAHGLPPQALDLIEEQATLIEAQVWVFGLIWVTQVLQRGRLISAEYTSGLVLACTCGLCDLVGDAATHAARGCTGIVQMSKSDAIIERFDGGIEYHEIKTKASPNLPWEQAWEHSGQLLINMESASRRIGKPVTQAYIPVLFKGWRGRDRNAPPEAAKYQHTPLCYGYHDAGSEGFRPAEWRARYEWTDDYGKGHKLPKTFQKSPIWKEDRPLVGTRVGASRVETWVTDYIQPEQWKDLHKLLGPFERPVARVPLALQGILAEETRWREDVEWVRAQVAAGVPEWQAADQIISRSWNCTGFDGTPCFARPICFRNPGWEDPGTMGIYQFRTPHHGMEKQAYEALGVTFVEEEAELDDVDW